MPLSQRPSAANEGRKSKDSTNEKPATKGVSIKVTPINGDLRSDKGRSDREDRADYRGRDAERDDIRKPGEDSRSRSRSTSKSRGGKKSKSRDGEEESSYEDDLRDALKDANTELNKSNSEKDRYRSLYDQASKKLSEHTKSIFELKTQMQTMKDDNALLKEKTQRYSEENDRLKYEISACDGDYTELKARYENLLLRYNATNVPSPDNPMAAPLGATDRTRPPRTPSKRDSIHRSDDKDGRGRVPRDREEKKEQEKRERKEAERRERKEAEKEQRAERERLSRRFEDRSNENRSRPPPTRSKRDSFVESTWSSSSGTAVNGSSSGTSRSTSANPSSRKYASGGMSSGRVHRPSPDMSPTHGYANVPRTSHAMSPGGMYSNPGSASGGSGVYEGDDYADGNYHPYPITR